MMPLWPYPFIFLLYAAFIIPSSVICEWHTIPPAASDNSYGFESSSSSLTSHSSSGYYRCPSVVCLRTFHASKERIDPYVHFMVGTTNPSSVPLTVYRLCDLFQHCLDRNNFMITVHIAKDRYLVPSFLFSIHYQMYLISMALANFSSSPFLFLIWLIQTCQPGNANGFRMQLISK